jgi:Ca2+-binding EF-hand superfamily protein
MSFDAKMTAKMAVADTDAVLARMRSDAPPQFDSDLARHFQPPVNNLSLIAHSRYKAVEFPPSPTKYPPSASKALHQSMAMGGAGTLDMEAIKKSHLPGAYPLGSARPIGTPLSSRAGAPAAFGRAESPRTRTRRCEDIMWRFEEGQLSFDEAMQETSNIHDRKLQYERKPPPRPTAGNEGARENMRVAQEKLREAQRENARLTNALQQPEGRHLGDLMNHGHQPDSRPVTPRAMTPRTREIHLEQDNARLRQQVSSLRTSVITAAIPNEAEPVYPGMPYQDGIYYSARNSARNPEIRKPRLVDGMGHEQMLREAQLRVQHNKQRQQLKGMLQLSAKGGENVGVDKLQIAARLAGVELPPRLAQSARTEQGSPRSRPQRSPRALRALRNAPAAPAEMVVPWREAMHQLDYPAVGTEGVAREAMERAAAKRKSLVQEAAQAREHKVNVLIDAEDEGITETELRAAHTKIRDHFSTRFSQVRRGFMLLDEDASGKLSYAELRSILLMFNLQIPAKHVQKIIELADMDGNGVIDYAEFARIISAQDICSLKNTLSNNPDSAVSYTKTAGLTKKKYREGAAQMRPGVTEKQVNEAAQAFKGELEEKYSRLTDAFKFIDSDRTGTLDRPEVLRLLTEFNIPDISHATIETLIDFADYDGDGEINYAEFARVLNSKDVFALNDANMKARAQSPR